MGNLNCFKTKYPTDSTILLNENYDEIDMLQVQNNSNELLALQNKLYNLEEETSSNIKLLSDDIHHLNNNFTDFKKELDIISNTNKILVKKINT